MICSQQNTIMVLKWTENSSVNQAGIILLPSKQLLLSGWQQHLQQHWAAPHKSYTKEHEFTTGREKKLPMRL